VLVRRPRQVVAAGAVVLAASGLAFGPAALGQTVRAGNLIVTVQGGFTPHRLPRHDLGAITLSAKSTISTADGTHLPAAKTLSLEFDKHARLNTRGLATCSVGRLQNTLTNQAEKICGDALVGTGRAGAEITFPEQAPFFASGKMLIFNGRPQHGHRVMIFHVYAHVPAPTTFVATAVIGKGSRGGTTANLTIPTIVAGQGSLDFAELTIQKSWKYRGRRQSLLLASCPTGHLVTRGELTFSGATAMSGHVVRSCSPIG
jgi:hypothetical protein